MASGRHTATATQTTDGGTSQESNANDFTIVVPPVLQQPANGSVTNDTTPTFRGTAVPGAQVEIVVDGNPIGTTTADGSGDFSFTPGAGLTPGVYSASARARVGSVQSGPSNTNIFRIDTDSPAAPVITSPEKGSTTTDRTPPITGTAEPGSEVIIFVDGEEVGSTVADEDGTFTFDLPDGLSLGDHEIGAKAVDEAGNPSVPSSLVTFAVLAARADAGQGPSDSLADTGGPQAWLPLVAGLGVLTGTGILAAVRRRCRAVRPGSERRFA